MLDLKLGANGLEPPIAVAYSGGADSTALLHLAARQWPGQVQAIHIQHGLQAAADEFVQYCRGACAQLRVPLHVVHVHAKNAVGESPEDTARRARYKALAAKVLELNQAIAGTNTAQTAIKSVALAQHADDQGRFEINWIVETNAQHDQHGERIHIERVERQNPISDIGAAQQTEAAQQHRDRQ